MINLPLKEMMAIELKYLGNTLKEISEKIDVSIDTLGGWFESNGKLYTAYNEFVSEMNLKRQKNLEDKLSVTDEEFFIITTNIVRKLGQKIQGKKVPLLDKEGRAVLDKEGKPIFIEEEPDFTVADLERVWKMQRIMKNLPTAYEKQEVENTNYEADVIIKELGLTEEDFNDANIESTTKKISNHLQNH